MDPIRIALRVLISYVVLLLLMRFSGKRTVHQGSLIDFTVVLIVGDLIDNLIWAEVTVAEFAVAASTVLLSHATLTCMRCPRGAR